MKNLFLLFFIAFSTVSGFSQIPEKANTITITLPDSATANEKVLKVLASKDYTIKDANKTVINTAAKTLKSNTRLSLTAKIKGAEVALTGFILIATEGSKRIEYKGVKGTPFMNAWEEMDKVAKALGGKVSYEIK
jgi:hypothetical protein